MRILSESEALRSFDALLDSVERGESFIITRADMRVAALVPVPEGNGAALRSLIAAGPDPDFASDIAAVRTLIEE